MAATCSWRTLGNLWNVTPVTLPNDIEGFFAQSGQALFSQPPQDNRAFLSQLVTLSKLLRDCERRAA